MINLEIGNFDTFFSKAVEPSQQQIIKMLEAQVTSVKQKWIGQFQRSIQLWMQYVMLRAQSLKTELKSSINNKENNENVDKLKRQLSSFISESQNSVLKALKNVEKLYMTPQLKCNKESKQKRESKTLLNSSDSNLISKSRSASLGSSGRLRRNSIFTSVKSKITSIKTKSKNQQNFNTVSSSNISKHFRPKPKYDTSLNSTIHNYLQIQTKQNFNDSIPEAASKQFLTNLLSHKQRNSQKKLIEQLSQKFEQRLNIIQSDISQKLNVIMTTMVANKSSASTSRINQAKQSPSSGKQKIEQISTKNIKYAVVKQEKDQVRKNSAIKKITANPIIDEESPIENVKIDQKLSQKKVQLMKQYEKNLEEFINTAKKVKLPISDALIKIFTCSYLSLCNELSLTPNKNKFETSKYEPVSKENLQKHNKQLKQCLTKLKKLLSMDGLKDKIEKVKAYVLHCLRCCYDFVVKDPKYMVEGDLQAEIDRVFSIIQH